MFHRLTTVLAVLLFAMMASASAIGNVARNDPSNQCNTGQLYCCNSVQEANSSPVSLLAGLLGIVLRDVTGLVGINCSPLSIIGIGGNSCSAQPVCCTGNSFSGLIVIGCSPININL